MFLFEAQGRKYKFWLWISGTALTLELKRIKGKNKEECYCAKSNDFKCCTM